MNSWPSLQPFRHTLSISDREVFYYDSSVETNQTPCLLIHGLGDEADTWHKVITGIASQRRVIAMDLPGFGRSAIPKQPISVLTYTQIILEFLDALKINRVLLVGHSMGATICNYFALTYPDRCSDLVLIAGGLALGKTPINIDLLLFMIPGIGEWVYNSLRRDPQKAFQTLLPYYHNLANLPQIERDFLFERVNQRVWSDKQRTGFLSALRSLARWLPTQQKSLKNQFSNFNVSTTILWGEQDRITPVTNGYGLISLLPKEKSKLITIPNCGHNLQQEKPEAVVDILAPA